PPPPPPPPAADWRDVPLTPGGWSYRGEGAGSLAAFAEGAAGARFAVRCDRGARQIRLERDGAAAAAAMIVRTTFDARSLPVRPERGLVVAVLDPRDPLLDSLAFSRGRFTVEAPGAPMLVIPAWPEPARVIEDCRG
ncbi:MAG TPA: hypothetical protein VGW34_14905, partial [Allosphingosinicella sp.]|nr:hypothetical protein [Allosphingosinicella sp.]